MGLEKQELDQLKAVSNKQKFSKSQKSEQQIAAELPEDGLDITDMLQLESSLDTDAASNTNQKEKIAQKTVQKEKAKSKSKGDNPWDTLISMDSMTTSVIDKTTPRVIKNTAKQRQDEQKEAEEEQSAINDARNELLKPEPIDKTEL